MQGLIVICCLVIKGTKKKINKYLYFYKSTNSAMKKNAFILWIPVTLLYLYMAAVQMPHVSAVLQEKSTEPTCAKPLDLYIGGFTSARAYKSLHCMGDDGRAYYRTIETRTDAVYPLVYGLFFALSVYLLGRYYLKNKWLINVLTIIPLVGMLFDYYENYQVVQLIDAFPVIDNRVAANAAFGNAAKWYLAFAAMASIVVLAIGSLIKRFRN